MKIPRPNGLTRPRPQLLELSDRLHLLLYGHIDLVVVIRLDGKGNKETVLHGTFVQMEKSIHEAIRSESELTPELRVAYKAISQEINKAS